MTEHVPIIETSSKGICHLQTVHQKTVNELSGTNRFIVGIYLLIRVLSTGDQDIACVVAEGRWMTTLQDFAYLQSYAVLSLPPLHL